MCAMLPKVTNKFICDKLQGEKSIHTIRRWAKEFLGDDPAAGRQMGIAREMAANEAWFMFLSGSIVEFTRLQFKTVKKAMSQSIKPWLLRNGLVPEIPKTTWPKGVDRKMYIGHSIDLMPYQTADEVEVAVRVTGYDYLQAALDTEDETGLEYSYSTLKEYQYWLVPRPENIVALPRGPRIQIHHLLDAYIAKIHGQNALSEWQKKFNQIHLE